MTASALILADLLLRHSALFCLTTLRTDLACGHSNFPDLAVSILTRATALLSSSASASCLATPRQALTIGYSFLLANAPPVGLAQDNTCEAPSRSGQSLMVASAVESPSPRLLGKRRHCLLGLVRRPRRRRCRGSSPDVLELIPGLLRQDGHPLEIHTLDPVVTSLVA